MAFDGLEIAIVHHRTPALLAQSLERLARYAPDVPVRIVDTAFDASLAVQLEGAHPTLEWLPLANHSYAAAVNAAAKRAARPLLLQLNADVLVGERTIPELLRALADPRVAAAGPLPLTPDGSAQDMGLPYRWHVARVRWLRAQRGPGAAVDVPWLAGCAQLLRLAALRTVGGYDQRLRFYNEDLEWCLRVRRAGWRCLLVATDVVHVGGAATPPNLAFLHEGLRGGYAITRRYGPAWIRPLHRYGLAATAWSVAQIARDAGARRSWRALACHSASDRLQRSRFGAELGQHDAGP